MAGALEITFKHDYRRFSRALEQLAEKELRYHAALALTDTARQVEKQVRAQLPNIFTKTTPFTLNAIGSLGANKDTLTATVFVKDLQGVTLFHEEVGGTREPGEGGTGARALLLPNAITLDQYGNIPRNALAKLRAAAAKDLAARRKLNAYIAFQSKATKASEKARAAVSNNQGVVFLAASQVPGRFGPFSGYFQRYAGHHLRRLTTFKGETHYQPKFGFRKQVERFAADVFTANLSRRFNEALGKVFGR